MLVLGRWRIREATDGLFALDGGAMFGVVPRVIWEKTAPPDALNRITLALRCLLVEEDGPGGRRVLVDAGIGDKWSPREREMFRIDRGSGPDLAASLRASGAAPDDVTDVVVSHLHFDHAGGLTRRDGDRITSVFPRARVHVQRDHWEWAFAPTEKDRASFREDDFAFLRGSPLLTLHDGTVEIYPGLTIRAGRGHTVGHQSVLIEGAGDGLVFTADTIPTAAHLRIPYVMGYDLHPLETIAEKKRMLEEILAHRWALAFDHEPGFAACRLARERDQFVPGERVDLG